MPVQAVPALLGDSSSQYLRQCWTIQRASLKQPLLSASSLIHFILSAPAQRSHTDILMMQSTIITPSTMTFMEPRQSRALALSHGWYRDLLIHYAEAHFIGLALFTSLGFSRLSDWQHFFHCFSLASDNFHQWDNLNLSLSFWTIFCLEFMISFQTHHNHQALAVHLDGNKKYPIETMALFSRSQDLPRASNERGSLYFPQHHVAIEMAHAFTMVNLHLNNTLHVADPSRNITNTTRVVHNPKTN